MGGCTILERMYLLQRLLVYSMQFFDLCYLIRRNNSSVYKANGIEERYFYYGGDSMPVIDILVWDISISAV